MVTASHNPVEDNGLKLVDASGGMLDESWEPKAAALANAAPAEVMTLLASFASEAGVAWPLDHAAVMVGRDTRPSSPHLAELVLEGARVVGARALDRGELTTPQLHFLVFAANCSHRDCDASFGGLDMSTGSNYSLRLSMAFRAGLRAVGVSAHDSLAHGELVVDAADGVGGLVMRGVADLLADVMRIRVINAGDGASPALNDGCGAEHVQKLREPPRGYDRSVAHAAPAVRACSLDGDADRVVFHCYEGSGADAPWHLIDGDKIAAVLATWVTALMRRAGGAVADLSVGVVQTAYANGASTRWLREHGVDVGIARTGVKFVHHRALDYDVGVYFEANGHGTVVFQERAIRAIDEAVALLGAEGDEESSPLDGAATATAMAMSGSTVRDAGEAVLAATAAMSPARALRLLQALTVLINQAIGDAISDALACELALRAARCDVLAWVRMYSDLPSRQSKVRVRDRTLLLPVDDETRLVEPATLQAAVDAAVARFSQGRAFVRPSGTEDVVRIYAEAATEGDAAALAAAIAEAVTAWNSSLA